MFSLWFRIFGWRRAIGVGIALVLTGCASLPSSGPTAGRIQSAARDPRASFKFDLVDIDEPVTRSLQNDASDAGTAPGLSRLSREVSDDVIGPGDILAISIYEVGVSLFNGSGGPRNATGAFDPSARAEKFPAVEVSAEGTISLPYIGILNVAGHSTATVQQMIEQAMIGTSQRAQALVTVSENVSSTVYVSGEVRKSGRVPLTPNREHLLDAIANAGGTPNSVEDTVVRFVRSGETAEQRLGTISSGSADDLVLMAGDRIALIRRPRSYLVFGATPKVSQVPFETADVTLGEAIARVGGPNDATADPSAVFLFRDSSQTATGRPVIYRLNLLEPASYILAQRIRMRDKDVIYISNARANRPQRLFGILSLLFSPFIAARELTR